MTEEMNEPLVSEEWDLSDPDLNSISPDIDPTEVPKQLRPAPPPDGYHFVKARLGNREGGAVYIKGTRGTDGRLIDGKVIAMVECRIYNQETGEEGAFLKSWWPTSQVMRGSKGSQITAICHLAGKPIKAGASLLEIKNHVDRIFAEAGEDGILLLVRTRWVKSVPKTQDLGGIITYVFKQGTEIKEYEEIKGESKIKALMERQGVSNDLAHLFKEPVTGEDRSVQAEVASLEDPSLLS